MEGGLQYTFRVYTSIDHCFILVPGVDATALALWRLRPDLRLCHEFGFDCEEKEGEESNEKRGGGWGEDQRTRTVGGHRPADTRKGQMGASACHIWMWSCACPEKEEEPNGIDTSVYVCLSWRHLNSGTQAVTGWAMQRTQRQHATQKRTKTMGGARGSKLGTFGTHGRGALLFGGELTSVLY